MNYSAINAKVKAMYGNLLKHSDYEKLAGLHSVEEVGLKLKDYHAYRNFLQGDDVQSIRRDTLERKLFLAMDHDIMRIFFQVNDQNIKKYLKAYFMKNDIQILKLIMCMIYDERTISYSEEEVNSILGHNNDLDVKKLLQAKTISECIESLQGTVYYKILMDVDIESSFPLFNLEAKLDLYYYMNLWKLQNKILDRTNKMIMTKIIGTEIDLLNILWIYRYKTYYNATDKIYSYLIPISHCLKRTDVNRLVESRNKEELMTEIQKTFYGKLFMDNNKIEDAFHTQMFKMYKKMQVMYPNSIATVLYYVFSKQLEYNNVTSLIEGVRYRLDYNEIMQFLVI